MRPATLVDRSGCWANCNQVTDFLSLIVNPSRADFTTFSDLYLEKGLSASEIAVELGLSKTAVIERLQAGGIRRARTGRDPNNYKFPKNPPYGYQVVNGRLVANRLEMKVARQIVELRDRQKVGWRVIAEKLNQSGCKTRKGRPWTIDTVENVHARWCGAL